MHLEKNLDGTIDINEVLDKSEQVIEQTVNSLLSFWTMGKSNDVEEALYMAIDSLILENCLFEASLGKSLFIKEALENTDYEDYTNVVTKILIDLEKRAEYWGQARKDFFCSCFSRVCTGYDFSSYQGDYSLTLNNGLVQNPPKRKNSFII